MISKPTKAHKCTKVYYTNHIYIYWFWCI